MDIGIIGAGHIGATAAKLFVRAGHRVTIGNSRGPASLRELVAELGERASAAEVIEVAEGADLVLIAVPLRAYGDLPAEPFAGTIVVDAMNYYPAGDDQDAVHTVAQLIEQLGFAAVITGDLAHGGRRQQPGTPVYATDLTAAQAAAVLAQE